MFIMSTQISLPKISLILQKMKVNLVNGHKHPFSGKPFDFCIIGD